mgnify:CR=1 FL=1
MKKRTLQLFPILFLFVAVFLVSCEDAGYGGDEPVGTPAKSLDGTSWKIIEQGVKIIPTSDAPNDYITMTGEINKFFADRLKTQTAIQTFRKNNYEVEYMDGSEYTGYETYTYYLSNDSITQNDGFLSEDEKGVALLSGDDILTIRVNISRQKLIALLTDVIIDPNLSDRYIKEIIYQTRGKKISE